MKTVLYSDDINLLSYWGKGTLVLATIVGFACFNAQCHLIKRFKIWHI